MIAVLLSNTKEAQNCLVFAFARFWVIFVGYSRWLLLQCLPTAHNVYKPHKCITSHPKHRKMHLHPPLTKSLVNQCDSASLEEMKGEKPGAWDSVYKPQMNAYNTQRVSSLHSETLLSSRNESKEKNKWYKYTT